MRTHDTVVMVLGDGDPSEPYIRRATAVYAHIVSTVSAAITARALRHISRAIWHAEGATLTIGLAIACWLRRAHDRLVETACVEYHTLYGIYGLLPRRYTTGTRPKSLSIPVMPY